MLINPSPLSSVHGASPHRSVPGQIPQLVLWPPGQEVSRVHLRWLWREWKQLSGRSDMQRVLQRSRRYTQIRTHKHLIFTTERWLSSRLKINQTWASPTLQRSDLKKVSVSLSTGAASIGRLKVALPWLPANTNVKIWIFLSVRNQTLGPFPHEMSSTHRNCSHTLQSHDSVTMSFRRLLANLTQFVLKHRNVSTPAELHKTRWLPDKETGRESGSLAYEFWNSLLLFLLSLQRTMCSPEVCLSASTRK